MKVQTVSFSDRSFAAGTWFSAIIIYPPTDGPVYFSPPGAMESLTSTSPKQLAITGKI
jgi:hypothetical protein